MSQSARRGATPEDLWAIPDEERFHELVAGEIMEKAAPSGEHGAAQVGIVGAVLAFQRRGGGSGPGGWWFATEVEVLLETGEIVRPDVLGWKRERCPKRPAGMPVKQRPDWICEIVSPSNAIHDTVKKLRSYQRAGIPHYWLADSRDGTLSVMRWGPDGYITVLRAERHEVVRAEPFEIVEIAVGTLFGDEPSSDEPSSG